MYIRRESLQFTYNFSAPLALNNDWDKPLWTQLPHGTKSDESRLKIHVCECFHSGFGNRLLCKPSYSAQLMHAQSEVRRPSG